MSRFEFRRDTNLLDARHFHLGRSDQLNMTIGVVGTMRGVPDSKHVAASLAGAVEQVPRLRQTLHPCGFDLRRPRWRDHPDFDLAEHFDVLEVPDRRGPSELLRTVDELQSEGFDPTRPLWRFRLLVLPGRERSVWHLGVHHAMADGATVAALLQGMFGQERGEMPLPTVPPERGDGPPAQAGNGPDGLPGTVLGLAEELQDTVRRPPQERGAGRWSRHRRSATFFVERQRWRDVARGAGGSTNDLFLAHAAHWLRGSGLVANAPDAFRVIMPVNTRTPADVRHFGNVTGGGCLFLDGGAGHLDDLGEVRRSSRAAQGAAHRPLPALCGDRLLDLLPGRLHARAAQRRYAKTDLLTTSVAVPGPLRVGGLPTDHVVIQPTVIGSAASVALTHYSDHLGLTVNFDKGIVPETTSPVGMFEQVLERTFGAGEVWPLEDVLDPDGAPMTPVPSTERDSAISARTDSVTGAVSGPRIGATATRTAGEGRGA